MCCWWWFFVQDDRVLLLACVLVVLLSLAGPMYHEWRCKRADIEAAEWRRFQELIRQPVWWTSGSIAAELGRPGKIADGYVWRYILRADYAGELEFSPVNPPEYRPRFIPAFRGVRRGPL